MKKTPNIKDLIAVTLIVKDEENNLLSALNSIKHICSQIVVVDTGSSDRTCQIASAFGCELHFFKWNDSFADARNYGIQFARRPWILSLDADEELVRDTLIKQAYLLDNEEAGGINLIIQNQLNDSKNGQSLQHRYTRLFRNNTKIFFSGRIHEQVRNSIEGAGFSVIESEITINHFGYSKFNQEKIERNKQLLEQELALNEKDDFMLYHLAETEFAAANLARAKQIFQNLFNSMDLSQQQKEITRIRLGQIYLKEGNFADLSRCLDFKSVDENREGFRKFILAVALLTERKFADAKPLIDSKEVHSSSLINKSDLAQVKELLQSYS